MLITIAEGSSEALTVRTRKVKDLFERMGVVAPDRIFLRNLPVEHPTSTFNPGLSFDDSSGCLTVYPRIVLGYYMYVSSIAAFRLCLDDIEAKRVNMGRYMADVILSPDNRYDIWGAEDPRVYVIDGIPHMTYTGRSINYFEPREWRYRTRPVTAAKLGDEWVKLAVHTPSHDVFGGVISDKNAFLYPLRNYSVSGKMVLFHRVHNKKEEFLLLVSEHEPLDYSSPKGPREYTVEKSWLIDLKADWESKLGWAAPPMNLRGDRVLVLAHSVDHEGVVYRVIAIELELGSKGPRVTAVTPSYIMEPSEPFEKIGDRPHVVFPCGLVKVDDHLLVSYGAADLYVGIARVEFSQLLEELDRGRLE